MPQISRNSLHICCFILGWHRPQKRPRIYPLLGRHYFREQSRNIEFYLRVPQEFYPVENKCITSGVFLFRSHRRERRDKWRTSAPSSIADCGDLISARKIRKIEVSTGSAAGGVTATPSQLQPLQEHAVWLSEVALRPDYSCRFLLCLFFYIRMTFNSCTVKSNYWPCEVIRTLPWQVPNLFLFRSSLTFQTDGLKSRKN